MRYTGHGRAMAWQGLAGYGASTARAVAFLSGQFLQQLERDIVRAVRVRTSADGTATSRVTRSRRRVWVPDRQQADRPGRHADMQTVRQADKHQTDSGEGSHT